MPGCELRDRPRATILSVLLSVPLLLAVLPIVAKAQTSDGAATPTPRETPSSAREAALEERLRKLEAMNRKVLDQYQELLDRESKNRQEADQRYRALERKYSALERQLESMSAGAREPERPEEPTWRHDKPSVESRLEPEAQEKERLPLRGALDEGFLLETFDEEYQLRVHILDQTDFKVFAPGDQMPARSGLSIPRLRVYFEGRLSKPFEYEVSIQRSVEGVFDILDANLNFHRTDAFQVKFGRFLSPYSYDWYDHLEQFFITPERGLYPLNFGLARQVGLMGWGRLFDNRLQYAIAGMDGHLVGVADNNTTREAVGYLNTRPFLLSDRRPALRFLNFGASMAGGLQVSPVAPLPLRTAIQTSENDEAAQSASSVFLEPNPGVAAYGGRLQGAVHLAWYVRQLSLEAEWQAGRFQFLKAGQPGRTTVPVTGYHITLGYFLTGETVERRTIVEPLRPFDLLKGTWGPGAIELFGRYSQLTLGQSVFSGGLANPEEWTRQAAITDVGLNWYLTKYIKIYFDWQHAMYGSPVLLNRSKDLFSRTNDLFWIRCQIYY